VRYTSRCERRPAAQRDQRSGLRPLRRDAGYYLVNADELQIRWPKARSRARADNYRGPQGRQGTLAGIRYSTPGVGLISPPPHHDIYFDRRSAQLIHDLKNANNRAVSASSWWPRSASARSRAGVSKAKGRRRLDQAATPAAPAPRRSPPSNTAGLPWELGLAETQQVLVDE